MGASEFPAIGSPFVTFVEPTCDNLKHRYPKFMSENRCCATEILQGFV